MALNHEGSIPGKNLQAGESGEITAGFEPLSEREHQVVQLIAKGFTSKAIGKQLSLSVRTVERYSSSIMKKLGLHKRAELSDTLY